MDNVAVKGLCKYASENTFFSGHVDVLECAFTVVHEVALAQNTGSTPHISDHLLTFRSL